MHDQEKSDSAIVAVKSPNKTGFPVAEAMERRAGTKGNADQQSTHRTQIRVRVTQALGRVRQADQRFAVNTQGRSRMLELGSSGSVRGVLSNEHPYREPGPKAEVERASQQSEAMKIDAAGGMFSLSARHLSEWRGPHPDLVGGFERDSAPIQKQAEHIEPADHKHDLARDRLTVLI